MLTRRRRSTFLGAALLLLAVSACEQPEPPPDSNPDALRLGPSITMNSGAWNVWTKRCSDDGAAVPRRMVIRQPASGGPYPVFVYLPGTARKSNHPVARGIIERAAGRGFVAVSVDYDSTAGIFEPDPCSTLEGKAACTFSVDAPDAPHAALNLVCNNVQMDGSPAGLNADCSRGVVVAGFSQGGTVAVLAKDYHPGVLAAWTMGHHDQGVLDGAPLSCVHGADASPPGDRALPADRSRVLMGADDIAMKTPHQAHLQALTGRTCDAGVAQCFDADGAGWAIVPRSECGGRCPHEFLDKARFWEDGNWWGAAKGLEWLTRFVP